MEPGDVVVCVDASRRGGNRIVVLHGDFIVLGRQYRVALVGVFEDGSVAVDLEGDPNSNIPKSAWEGNRFRPLRPNEKLAREQWAEMLRTKPVLNPHSKERA